MKQKLEVSVESELYRLYTEAFLAHEPFALTSGQMVVFSMREIIGSIAEFEYECVGENNGSR